MMANIIDNSVELLLSNIEVLKSDDVHEIRKKIFELIGQISIDDKIHDNINIIDILVDVLAHHVVENNQKIT